MTDDQTSLRRTALYQRHLAHGAKTANFGGWDMPIEYQGVVAEHEAVRNRAAMFDVSHMGKVRVHGPGAVAYLNTVLANDLDRIGSGQAQYSMVLNNRGGIVDDLIVYRWADDDAFLVPNAANAATVAAVLQSNAPRDVSVENQHDDYGILAVQGPASAEVLAAAGLPYEHDYMTMVRAHVGDAQVIVSRTGYTGEHGYEVVVPVAALGELWDALLAAGTDSEMVPAGLGARDTLRTEMGYPLHGQDITEDITPVDAMLGWAVGWDKPAFTGRTPLTKQRAERTGRRLRGIRALDRAIPRPHMTVVAAADGSTAIGEVTSGTFSPTLKQGIGLALLDGGVSVGEEVVVDVRGKAARFAVVHPPFVTANTRNG